MTDADFAFAETPSGQKAHIVDFGRRSMLARGTKGAADFLSLCGEVPTYWERLDGPPDDPVRVCATCRQSVREVDGRMPDVPDGDGDD